MKMTLGLGAGLGANAGAGRGGGGKQGAGDGWVPWVCGVGGIGGRRVNDPRRSAYGPATFGLRAGPVAVNPPARRFVPSAAKRPTQPSGHLRRLIPNDVESL